DEGHTLIFISHKLDEVLAIADDITVMRRGTTVATVDPQAVTARRLAELMVGSELPSPSTEESTVTDRECLVLTGVTVRDHTGRDVLSDINLTIRAGEVLGIAGVEGNGQTELVEALTGLRRLAAGRVLLEGRDLTNAPPRRLFGAGLSHVPEDRRKHGLVLTYPVADNLVLSSYHQRPFADGLRLVREQVLRFARRVVREFDIRTPSVQTPVQYLSGGNQQKTVVGREFSRPMRLLIAAQPTRGLDIGSIEFIHRRIIEARDQGTAVLLVSAELDEVTALADRVAVLYRGRVAALRPADRFTREELGLLMAGAPATPEPGTPSERVD
ncbi:MAG TPA: ATP-binding cassette domain-containing protein, partial [Chloroflexota bacterium]|nr:ATP-binding cassette domain-containing protein [Chloroflexota bacterium]